MKEWKLLKDYTVAEGESYQTISTPEENEMTEFKEIFILFESLTVQANGIESTNTSVGRPVLADYNDENYSYGRISADIANSIGSSILSRKLYLYAKVIDNFLVGHAGNATSNISSFTKITASLPISSIPKININNSNGYYYSAGTNIKVYGR